MNRHLAIKTSCFCVLELRNSPAITRIPRLESEPLNHNLFDPDLIRDSLDHLYTAICLEAETPLPVYQNKSLKDRSLLSLLVVAMVDKLFGQILLKETLLIGAVIILHGEGW